MLYEKAPAKINLTLDVLHKREDGFHEVEMVMTTVDLADRVWFRSRNDGRITIKTSEPFIPNDRKNLAYQAAELIKAGVSDVRDGVEITLEKSIPVAAGLAGGSSDAAATLRGLNRLWNLGLRRGQASGARGADWFGCFVLCIRWDGACDRSRGSNSKSSYAAELLGNS